MVILANVVLTLLQLIQAYPVLNVIMLVLDVMLHVTSVTHARNVTLVKQTTVLAVLVVILNVHHVMKLIM